MNMDMMDDDCDIEGFPDMAAIRRSELTPTIEEIRRVSTWLTTKRGEGTLPEDNKDELLLRRLLRGLTISLVDDSRKALERMHDFYMDSCKLGAANEDDLVHFKLITNALIAYGEIEWIKEMSSQDLRRIFNKITHSIHFNEDLILSQEDKRIAGRCVELILRKRDAAR